MRRRLTIEEYQQKMYGIVKSLDDHIGQKVMLLIKDGRNTVPLIGKLRRVADRVYGDCQMYDNRGRPCDVRSIYVDPRLIHTGDMRVEFFDTGCKQ